MGNCSPNQMIDVPAGTYAAENFQLADFGPEEGVDAATAYQV